LSASLGLAQSPGARDLTDISLEDLMNIQVTSVSKKEQKLAKTGAAVFVITQEDIRRSGATNIPDVLRMAPGVDVARVDANRWAISIRGFNAIFSNKVLVLIDGRSVYVNVGSNVFWDDHGVPVEDIDHIEVIRGPGGTVWGANAVNGVINIITKSSKATQGGLITAGTGSAESAESLAQYGGKFRSNGTYRVFGKYFNVETSVAPSGQNAADGWHSSQGGFRSDWDLSPKDSLTVQGDLLTTSAGQTVTTVFSKALPLQRTVNDRQKNTAGNILGRWDHTFANGSDSSLQISSDVEHRHSQFEVSAARDMTDVDFDHHVALGSRNDVVWGLGYRFETDNLLQGFATRILPLHSTHNSFSTFVQDEIKLTNSLLFTLGSKFEHNSFTGFEYEPSAQLVWTPSGEHTVWASAARAIRQPSLVDFGLQVDLAVVALANGSFVVPTLVGNPNTRDEQLHDYEAGYRTQLNRRVSLDVTGFWSFYRNLITQEPGAPFFTVNPAPPHLILPLVWDNKARAQNYGGEVTATWDVNSRWKISPSYSLLHMSIMRDSSSRDSAIERTIGNSPKHQLQIRSWIKLRKNVDWDGTLMYVSGLTNLGVPGYARLDTRLGWRVGEFVELSIVGQNLLRARHMEFSDPRMHATEAERSVFGKVTWRF
jgi:iron complex outermembrane recepter protein